VLLVTTSPYHLFDFKCSIRALDDKIYFHFLKDATGAVLINSDGLTSNSFINFSNDTSATFINDLTQDSTIASVSFSPDNFNIV